MKKQIFVNLAVKDLKKTMDFFSHLGFSFNPQFTDDRAACMIIEENIFVMLLLKDFFKGFTKKELADAHKSTEVIICISCDSREAVDAMVRNALEAGGTAPVPNQDHGWMYQHGFADLDGHQWEVMWADVAMLEGQNAGEVASAKGN